MMGRSLGVVAGEIADEKFAAEQRNGVHEPNVERAVRKTADRGLAASVDADLTIVMAGQDRVAVGKSRKSLAAGLPVDMSGLAVQKADWRMSELSQGSLASSDARLVVEMTLRMAVESGARTTTDPGEHLTIGSSVVSWVAMGMGGLLVDRRVRRAAYYLG